MHLRCDFFSETLQLSTSMTVLLPQLAAGQIGMAGVVGSDAPPVLYLLHGLSDDDTIWLRRTSIERYAAELGLAVVMPAVQRSFYTDQAHGGRFWQFVSDELPQIVDGAFRVSTDRADTFVAGLSMGGYGAVKLALRRPERYAAAGSLSGALDLVGIDLGAFRPDVADATFGDDPIEGTDNDLLHLLRRCDPKQIPPLWITCGTQDPLICANHRFAAEATTAGVEVTAEFHRGEHEWGYWDRYIQDFLAWIPLRNRPVAAGA